MNLAIVPEEWAEHALCAQVGGDLWFPDRGGDLHTPRAICQSCPVIEECLQYALDHREQHGMWGGMTERQRRCILERQEKAA